MTEPTTTPDQNRVIDRMLFSALSLAADEREKFVRRLGEHVLRHLAEKGYTDGEILLARIKFTEMIRERLLELQAISPDRWGNA
jgi:hypothetical protein